MRKLVFMFLSSLLIFNFFGCVTTDKNVGKRLPSKYYVASCEIFPAQGVQRNKDIEIDYQISKLETNKYQITGAVKPVFGGTLTLSEYSD